MTFFKVLGLFMTLIEAYQLSEWQPKIGDPSPIGWITVGLYVLSFFAGLGAMIRIVTAEDLDQKNRLVCFFIFYSGLILFLGVNKQLDLQTLFTDVFRIISKEEGWYSERKFFQKKFIVFISTFGLLSFLLMSIWLRSFFKRIAILLLGICALIGFILIRAASLHYMDFALRDKFYDIKLYAIIEVTALAIILVGVFVSTRKLHQVATNNVINGNESAGWHKFGE
jgi:hypothetical protein